MAVKQRWKCGICGYTYVSPIAVSEALCPKPHTTADLNRALGKTQKSSGRSGLALMELIEGSLPDRGNK